MNNSIPIWQMRNWVLGRFSDLPEVSQLITRGEASVQTQEIWSQISCWFLVLHPARIRTQNNYLVEEGTDEEGKEE